MLRRFAKEKTAVFGLAVIVFFALVAVFAPLLTPYDPLAQDPWDFPVSNTLQQSVFVQ